MSYPPTPFSSANAVGMLKTEADDLGITKISDLTDHQDLTLAGSPECRERIDCLAGLEKYYGLDGLRDNFTPVDIGLRYEVLDKGDADLSIIFTTDAQLFTSDDYVTLEDDKHVLPAGNVMFIASQEAADEAGPDFGATIEKVQGSLSLEVMQELNARVDIDKEKPEQAAPGVPAGVRIHRVGERVPPRAHGVGLTPWAPQPSSTSTAPSSTPTTSTRSRGTARFASTTSRRPSGVSTATSAWAATSWSPPSPARRSRSASATRSASPRAAATAS